MEELFNFNIYGLDAWFENNWQQVDDFCSKQGISGIELLATGIDKVEAKRIPARLVKGLHLSYQSDWLSLNQGSDWLRWVEEYRRQLELARTLEVEYVVLHAAYAEPEEIINDQFNYSDSFILNKIAEITNEITSDTGFNAQLLFENLWWNGLKFLSKKQLNYFLTQIDYSKIGLMLDTGHLLNTDFGITDEKEAVTYIKEKTDDLEDNIEFIQGIHLHKSLAEKDKEAVRTEAYREFSSTADEQERTRIVGRYIGEIDSHRPFSEVSLRGLLKNIDPNYLIHEFTTKTKKEFIDYLQQQKKVLN